MLPRQLMDREPITIEPPAPPSAGGLRASLLASAPATDDRWLMGRALREYQETHGLGEQQLAEHLGLAVERLRWLQMRTRPNPQSPTYAADVERLASAFGCCADILLEVLG